MNSNESAVSRSLPSDWLLLGMIVLIPFMTPPVLRPVIAADLLFTVLAVTFAVEALLGLRRLRWLGEFGALAAYACGLAPSLLASSDIDRSLFKYATEIYLILLAGLTAIMVDSQLKLHRALLAWLAATALVCLVAAISLVAFVTGPSWILDYTGNGFGSLPPGDYPRLALTFWGANMACNYLNVSLGLAIVAHQLGVISRTPYSLLLAGIVLAALSTISAGLGGLALLAGVWIWIKNRRGRPAFAFATLTFGLAVAAFFIIALAVTPFAYSNAPTLVRLPGGVTLYAAGHILTWSAALSQFLEHPLIGIGIGIEPIRIALSFPGERNVLTDAHNIFLSIGAQCGVVGLAGLAVLLWFVIRRTPWSAALRGEHLPLFVLGATFLDVFVYQGLGGSFEDTRHVWALLGLFIAAARLDLSRAGENNRRADAPSSG
ncbi:MAG: O-antigen ligase family protein [Pseudomonadota bacterium]